jgi:hypothetical protein
MTTVSEETAETVLLPSFTQPNRVLVPSPPPNVKLVVTSFQPVAPAAGVLFVVDS